MYPPPDVAAPSQVGVLDHGQHSSLILQIPDGMVRYSYGDWKWYALRQTGPAEGIAALFWPTQAGLGRKQLPGPFSPMAVSREVRVGIENAVYFTVDARAVHQLVDSLERIFDENSAGQVYNEAYDLVFVPHPDPYTIAHNSNRVVAGLARAAGLPGRRNDAAVRVAAGRRLIRRVVPRRVSITPPGDGHRGRSAPRPRRRSSKDRGLSED